jgi:hypothetical protein
MSDRQQQDHVVCDKIEGYKHPVTNVQIMSMPITRSDDYVPQEGSEALEAEQSSRPWVITGPYCYTEMEPNINGTGAAKRLDPSQLHIWTASMQASKKLKEVLQVAIDAKEVCVHMHETYKQFYDVFSLESNKNNLEREEKGPGSSTAGKNKKNKKRKAKTPAGKKKKAKTEPPDETASNEHAML